MYHSVTFGSRNTFSDWHLVPDERPVIAMPEPKIVTVDVPGRNGVLDLTESVRNFPVYNNRKGKLKFHVLNGYGDWHGRYELIANYLHGKNMQVRLEDEPGWYYTGRITVDEWKSNNNGTWSDITFGYDLQPYKLSEDTTMVTSWKWDTFSFVSGFIIGKRLKEIPITSSWKRIYLEDYIGHMPVTPTFIIQGGSVDIRVVNDELGLDITKWAVSSGAYTWPEIIFTNMSNFNDIYVEMKSTSSSSANRKVSISYRWGTL